MDQEKERILEKLAKLLTLSNDQAGKPEGIAARAMAIKLMAKHSIEETEINLEDGKGVNAQTIFEDEDGWEGLCDRGGKRQWVANLAWSIANTFNARTYTSTRQGTIHFLATAGDLETCLYFMDVVYSHIEKAARKQCPKPEDWKKRNVFGQAAWQEVDMRLADLKREMKAAFSEYTGGTELVIVKDALVQKTVDELFRERGYGKSKDTSVRGGDAGTIAAGRIAGKTAPLHRAIR